MTYRLSCRRSKVSWPVQLQAANSRRFKLNAPAAESVPLTAPAADDCGGYIGAALRTAHRLMPAWEAGRPPVQP